MSKEDQKDSKFPISDADREEFDRVTRLRATPTVKKRTNYKAQYAKQKRLRELEEAQAFDCAKAIDEERAREILNKEWSRNANVINQAYKCGAITANLLGLVPNSYYWVHGATRTLEAKAKGENLSPVELSANWNSRSEVLSQRELYSLYTFSCAGRNVLDSEVSFDDWLGLRDRCRKDLYYLAEILKVPVDPVVHGSIIETIYPRINSDGCFPSDGSYQLAHVHKAMQKQSAEIRDFLIMDPRGWLKSAVVSVFALLFLFNYPDGRVFCCSGTDDLAVAFLRIVKGYIAANEEPSTINLLFPEYTLRSIAATSDSDLELPCRKYKLKNPNLWAQGATSATSGSHCDLYIADDIQQSIGSETTRENLKNKADTLASNIPDGHALRITLGTRYGIADIYSYKIALLDEDPTLMKYWCRGVFTPKTGFGHIPTDKLELNQVDLHWPNKDGKSPEQNWIELKRKMKINLSDFLNQQMNDPVSPEQDDKVTFDPDFMQTRIKNPILFPQAGNIYLIVDVAHSLDLRADYSVILVARAALNEAGDLSLYVLYVDAARYRNTELATRVAVTAQRYNPKTILLEKLHMQELLINEIQKQAMTRGYSLPIVYPMPIDHAKNAKWNRIKKLELHTTNDRLWIAEDCGCVPLLMDQFCRYTGKRSSTRHDDIPDACGLLARAVLGSETGSKDVKAREQMEQRIAEQQMVQDNYQRIFGGISKWSYGIPVPATPEPETPFSSRGTLYEIPGLRPISQSLASPSSRPPKFWRFKT